MYPKYRDIMLYHQIHYIHVYLYMLDKYLLYLYQYNISFLAKNTSWSTLSGFKQLCLAKHPINDSAIIKL